MSLSFEFKGYVCPSCDWADFHRVDLCPRCAGAVKELTFEGKGKIVTYTAIRYPPKGFEDRVPYVVAIIDIENGPRVIGRVSNSVDEVKIGSAVSLSSIKEGALEFRLAA